MDPRHEFSRRRKQALPSITLDVAPTTNTTLSLSTSDDLKVALPGPTVLAIAGSRYVTFQVGLNGVDADSNVTVSATSNGVTATSPVMKIKASYLVRVTINGALVNELHSNVPVELKITLSGPAGPSGFVVSYQGFTSADLAGNDADNLDNFLARGGEFMVSFGSSILRQTITPPQLQSLTAGSGQIYFAGPRAPGLPTPFTWYP